MARYRLFIEAVQWTGANVTEIRQFVRANSGTINDAIIIDGVLTLRQDPGDELRPDVPIQVLVTEWIVISAGIVRALTDAVFISQYVLDV